MNRITTALAAGCASILATTASAQDAIMALNPTTMIGYAGTTAGNAYKPRDFGPRLTASARPSAAPRRVTAAQVVARTTYRPDAAVRNQVYARAVQMMAKGGSADAEKLRQILMSGKMRNEVAGILGRYGMSPDNLVDTTALYLAVAWLTTHGNNGAPSAAQLGGLRRQVALAYGSIPQIMTMSNAAKQELAESNILQASLASTLAEQAGKDAATSAKARAVIANWVQQSYSVDLRRMNLTAQGLR